MIFFNFLFSLVCSGIAGRGIFYFLLGISLCLLGFILDAFLGIILACVGASYFLLGRRTAQKLSQKRGSDTSQNLQEQFAMADLDGKGSLTQDQFRQFTSAMGLELNKQESEVAFLTIDQSRTGRLSYEAVHAWWEETPPSTNTC